MSQFELIDETGASRFRGTQRPPGGGSQTVKAVDLGVIDITSVFSGGPQVLYTLQTGEALAAIRYLDDVFEQADSLVDVGFGIGTVKSFGWASFAPWTPPDPNSPTDTIGMQIGDQAYGPDLGGAGPNSMVLSAIGDVNAAWFYTGGAGSGPGWMFTPVVAWQAATTYDVRDYNAPDDLTQRNAMIVANGTVWSNIGATGMSGSSEPDFAGNAGGTVADGADIVWADTTKAPPTTGKVHAVAEIWTPA